MPISNLLQNGCCCGGDTYGGTTGDIPGCLCDPSPTTLTMTSSDHAGNGGMFQDATLQWGPRPAALAGLTCTDPGYYSTTTFTDSTSVSSYYYYVTCSSNTWTLTRAYPDLGGGGPFLDIVRYTWANQTCSPFASNNTCGGCGVFSGGTPVSITLTG